MKPYKLAFLVNPVSGGGQGRVLMSYIPEIMNSVGLTSSEWTVESTEISSFDEQIDRLIEKSEKLIAVGGDGTMSAILRRAVHFKDRQEALLGLIPLGTGNDLARMMNIYQNFKEKGLVSTVKKLIQAPSRAFDVWIVNDRYTLSAYLSVGLDAKIAHHFDEDRKQGKIRFKSALYNRIYYMRLFWRFRNWRIKNGAKVEFSDLAQKKHSFDLSLRRSLIIGNINSYAGGSNPFGNNDFSDGLLEIVPIRSFWKWAAAILTNTCRPFAWFFSHYISPSSKAQEIFVSVPEGEFVQIDGEDLSAELAGKTLHIRHFGQVKLLVFQE
jgi:diacylglycerol kinase family enzyme